MHLSIIYLSVYVSIYESMYLSIYHVSQIQNECLAHSKFSINIFELII